MKPDFEQYLIEKFSEDYVGGDDEMMDEFAVWSENLAIENLIAYANKFAEEYRRVK